MTENLRQAKAAQASYSKLFLWMYDVLVMKYSCKWIWKCEYRNYLRLYNQNITNNHLEVGVGNGFLLDHCRFNSKTPRIALMDINSNCLEISAKRLKRFSPEVYWANVLDPIKLDVPHFDSIGINHVLHCLPGSLDEKGKAIASLKKMLNPNGILFGSTVLNIGTNKNYLADITIKLYNKKGVFNNLLDSVEGLENMLKKHFVCQDLKVIGCMGIFQCKI